MRRLSHRDIHAWRAVATWLMRAPAVALITVGAYLALKKLLFGVGTRNLDMIYDVWEGVGEGHSFYRGLAMIAVGAALGVMAPRLARWVVTIPARGCPRCGYAADEDQPCPECGLPPDDPRG